MPIGPITPGSFVTVTPDFAPGVYTSLPAPTATMLVRGSDIQNLTLAVLNIQKTSVSGAGGLYAPATQIEIDGAGMRVGGAGLFVTGAGLATDVPIKGDGTHLLLGQVAETAIFLGALLGPAHQLQHKILLPDPSGGQTYSILDGNIWYLPDETVNKTWHLGNTGVGAGIVRMIFVSAQKIFDAGHGGVNLTIDFNAGANSVGFGSSGIKYAILLFDGTVWGVLMAWS